VILAALPASKAGVGSAVNATTRELGGALGVAVVGSVLSWSFSARLADLWGGLGVPPGLVKAGQASLGDALAVGAQAAQSGVTQAARTSFMAGLHAGSAVAAGAALLAAIVAVVFLPQRDRPGTRPQEPSEQPRDLAKVQ
jgi:DHA2 family multidrug resistance protein-like MFS transporter